MSNALGGIQLQVPAPYATQAVAVLEADASPSAAEGKCNACGGSSFSKSNMRWKLSFFLFHFFSIPLPWADGKMLCDNCGREREESDAD